MFCFIAVVALQRFLVKVFKYFPILQPVMMVMPFLDPQVSGNVF